MPKKDYDRVIADFDEAIKLDPECAYAYGHRGYARQVKGNLDGAVADYQSTLRLNLPDAKKYRGRSDPDAIHYREWLDAAESAKRQKSGSS